VKLYSVRFDEAVVDALKRLALQEGLVRGRQTHWCEILREAAWERLQRGATQVNSDREDERQTS
jgi:hypothetical protein